MKEKESMFSFIFYKVIFYQRKTMFFLENGDVIDVKLFFLNQRYGSFIESDDVFVEFDYKGI